MVERDESPEAVAHVLVTRIFDLLHECRAVLPKLEALREPGAASVEAKQLLYVTLLGAVEARLTHTMEQVQRDEDGARK